MIPVKFNCDAARDSSRERPISAGRLQHSAFVLTKRQHRVDNRGRSKYLPKCLNVK